MNEDYISRVRNDENPYPFPIVEKYATVSDRFKMMESTWTLVHDTKYGPAISRKTKIKSLWITFKYYFLTRRPLVAYRKDAS